MSYLIDFKWFESWKMYVKQEYGHQLNTTNKKPITFKTKKMLKNSGGMNGSQKVADTLNLRELKFDDGKSKKPRSSAE